MIKPTIATTLADAYIILSDVVDNPRIFAESLMAHVVEQPRSYLYAWPEHELTEREQTHFAKHVQQGIDGKPLAYMTNVQEFWSLPFKVNQHTLIPRPDTELLVATILQHYPQQQKIALLELGTGTGAIAAAIASERPQWQITATDCSPDALTVAMENTQNLNLKNIALMNSDWYQAVPTQQFNIIVSNPPYIAKDDPAITASVKQYEPHLALFAEEEGLAALRIIIQSAPHYLITNGLLCVEHGYQQGAQVRDLFQAARFHEVVTLRDSGNHERVTLGFY